MTDLGWIAFDAKLPEPNSRILVVYLAEGDTWAETFGETIPELLKEHVAPDANTPWAYMEAFRVESDGFGVNLYRSHKHEEIGRHEYAILRETGYWIEMGAFLKQFGPFIAPFAVEGFGPVVPS